MIEIADHRYTALLNEKRAGCCDTWPKPCEPCNCYAEGLERGYRECADDATLYERLGREVERQRATLQSERGERSYGDMGEGWRSEVRRLEIIWRYATDG